MPIEMHEGEGGKLLTVHVSGNLTRTDYERFVPEFEALFRRQGKLRVLFDMTGFRGLDAAALWAEIKFDVKHLDDIERCAMVGDRQWERAMTAFSQPFTNAKIKYFDRAGVADARAWLAQPGIPGAGKTTITPDARDQNPPSPNLKPRSDTGRKSRLTHLIIEPEVILVLEPHAPLEASDFEELAREIDPLIAQHGKLPGLLIRAKAFPGWANVDAFLAHMRFIKSHLQNILRLAIVSDSVLLTDVSRIGAHLVQAQVKQFADSDYVQALQWLEAASGAGAARGKSK